MQMNKNKLTKAQAKEQFVDSVLDGIPRHDIPMLEQAWNDYTDMLCKDGLITDKQYRKWTHPRFTKDDWIKAKSNSNAR